MFKQILLFAAAAGVLSACGKNQGDPFRITRSACPAVAVLQNAGDVTTFNPLGSRDASAIDVSATITNLRAICTEGGERLATSISFDVLGLRRDASAARSVTLPWFATVVQGGDKIVAKQTGTVTLAFAEGQPRAQARATAQSSVARSAVTLPEDVREKITRKRKAGDADAAIDPLAEPTVREAVRAASFEVVVGFQLDEAGLAYNVGR